MTLVADPGNLHQSRPGEATDVTAGLKGEDLYTQTVLWHTDSDLFIFISN